MNLQSLLGFSIAGLSLVFSVGFFAHQPAPIAKEPDLPLPPGSYTEVMPEQSGESFRLHVRNQNGIETEVRIRYLDGTNGILNLYESGSVETEKRFFADGETRKEARFSEDGLVLAGHERRIDRSILWKVVESTDSRIALETYFPDGKIFQKRIVDLSTGLIARTFYRTNGSLWQEDVIDHAGLQYSQRVFDERGRLRIESVLKNHDDQNNLVEVVYFDDHGKPEFDQRYGVSASVLYPMSGINQKRLLLKSVGKYSNGKLSSRTHLTPSGRIHQIEEFREDSTRRLFVQYHGQITQIEIESSGGARSSRFDFEGKFGIAPPLEDQFRQSPPDGELPVRQFEEQERAFLEQSLDAP